MPQAAAAWLAGALFTSATTAFGVATAVFVANYGAVALTLGALAIQSVQASRTARKMEAAARSQYEASLQDRTVVIRSPLMPRNIVLGRDRVSGSLAQWFTWGDVGKMHTFAVTLAGHECDAIETVWFNAEPVDLDGDGFVTTGKYQRRKVLTMLEQLTFDGSGNAVTQYAPVDVGPNTAQVTYEPTPDTFITDSFTASGTTINAPGAAGRVGQVTYSYEVFEPLFQIRKYLGAPGQAAAPEMIAAAAAAGVPGSWDASRRGTSVCYLTVEMEADYDVLGQIGVPNISAVVRGVKAYDPRTGLTQWSYNPAILLRWFLVDSIYSPTTLSSEIGSAELIASANVCDEVILFAADRPGPRYVADGTLSTDALPIDNMRQILDAMDGDCIWISGAWQIVAGRHIAPSLTITPSDLADDDIILAPYAPKDKLFNLVTGEFTGPNATYARTTYNAVAPAAYLAQDNGEVLSVTMSFELVNDPVRCQMIAWQRLTRARQAQTIQFSTNLRGYDSWPTQNVSLVLPELLGPVAKTFNLRRREFSDGKLAFVAQETSAAVWNWSYADAQAAVDIPNTSLPDAITLPAPVITAVESGDAQLLSGQDGTITSRIKVTLAGTQNGYILNGGAVETRYAPVAASEWQSGPTPPGDMRTFWFSPVEDGVNYKLQARYRNSAGRLSAWSTAWMHVVVGKLEAPPDVTSLTISGIVLAWPPVAANDLAGYVFRFHYGQNSDWGSAAPLLGSPLADGRFDGVVTESPYELSVRPSGTVTIMVKAIDTSGNVSVNPASIYTNLGDTPVANVVEVIDFEALGWPGVITGGTIVGTDIVASDTGLFYGFDTDPFYGNAEIDLFYPPGAFSQLVYLTDPVSISSALAGSLISLDIVGDGVGLIIEYRLVNPSRFYGSDADLFYGADSVSFYESGAGGAWMPWPGQLAADNDIYQFRVTLGSGAQQGVIDHMALTIDAPDKEISIDDLLILSTGTLLPLPPGFFSVIKTIQGTLQVNLSGATTLETDKTANLAPKAYAYNSSHTPVSGATADFNIKGY